MTNSFTRFVVSLLAFGLMTSLHALAAPPKFDAQEIGRTVKVLETQYGFHSENISLKDVLERIGKATKLKILIEEDAGLLPATVSENGKLGDILTTVVTSCKCEITITASGALLVRLLPDNPNTQQLNQSENAK